MAAVAQSVLASRDVAADHEGLRIAAREMFEEALAGEISDKIARRIAGAANEESARGAGRGPRRTLGGGYYSWVEYLLSLEAMIAAGIRFGAADMQMREVDGLQTIAAVRNEFRAAHPNCPSCGALLQNAFVGACWKCNQKLGRKK
jgi:hypothetical protein